MVRRNVALLALPVLVLALGACGEHALNLTSQSRPSAHRTHSQRPAPTSSTPTSPGSRSTTSSKGAPTATATSTVTSTVADAATSPPACRTHDLSLSASGQRAGNVPDTVEDHVTDFALTNRGGTTCQVTGWPTVVLRGNATQVVCEPGVVQDSCGGPQDKDSIDTPPVRTSAAPRPVVVEPGRQARFSLLWWGTICLSPAYRVQVSLPGSAASLGLVLPDDATVCVHGPRARHYVVQVTPVSGPTAG